MTLWCGDITVECQNMTDGGCDSFKVGYDILYQDIGL